MLEKKGLVRVRDHRLAYTCMGSGSPVVVLEAGGGTPRGTWYKILPAVAEFTQVVSYDRLGIGESDLAQRGRNGDDLVDDLAKLLYNIGTSAPYILVGNSLGGQIIRYFTHLHAKDVVGLVLLDSTHHDQHRQALALMPPPSPEDNQDFITLRRNLTNLMDGIINDPEQDPEALDYLTFDNQMRQAGSLGDIPLVVITAGNQRGPNLPYEYIQAYQKMFRGFQIELSRLSTRGTHIIVEQSGHFIQEDEPELVVNTIHKIVDLVRQEFNGLRAS